MQTSKNRLQDTYRKLHRYVGLGALLFLVLLSLSGFMLNHPQLLGAPAEHTLSFAVDPLDPNHLYRGTRTGLFASDDGGESWYEVPMLFTAERAIDIAFAPDNPDHIYVALEELGLIQSSDGGIIWEQVSLGFVPIAEGVRMQRLGIGANGQLHIWTASGLLKSTNAGRTWTSIGDASHPGDDLYTLVHQIHTGYYFGNGFVYLYDATAWGIIALSVSGVVIWWRSAFKKRRTHQRKKTSP